MEREATPRLVILIPVFNDWQSIALLLPALDHALKDCPARAEVLLVDDGSTEPLQPGLLPLQCERLHAVNILYLRRNIGHQRAIAVGLVHIHQHLACDAVVVMDGDGEDRPSDVVRLVDEFRQGSPAAIVFAARAKRMEKFSFQLCYRLYCALHWLLTGVRVRIGNFSIVPWQALSRLVIVSELWNHYAAAVVRAKLPYRTAPIDRGRRIHGESKMNFVSLLVHGLSAISVFSDVVGTRLLILAFSLAALAAPAAVMFAMAIRSGAAVPAWAVYGAAVLCILLAQSVLGAFLLVFMVVSARANMTFIPLRDAHHFIDRQERVFPLDNPSLLRLRAGNF